MSIGGTTMAAAATENAGGSGYAAAGEMDAEEMEDGFASAEVDEASDAPCGFMEWTENEEEMMAAGAESGYETALTDRGVETEHEEMPETGREGENVVDVYSINFTPVNGPASPYEWKPCCPSTCVMCFEQELVTPDTVLDD